MRHLLARRTLTPTVRVVRRPATASDGSRPAADQVRQTSRILLLGGRHHLLSTWTGFLYAVVVLDAYSQPWPLQLIRIEHLCSSSP